MRETGASPEVPDWYLEMPGSSKVSDSASRESRVPRRLAVYWDTRGSLERLHSYPKTPVSRASLNRLGILRYGFSIWRHSRVSQEANGLSGDASLGRIFAYTEDNLVSQETISTLERPKRCGDASNRLSRSLWFQTTSESTGVEPRSYNCKSLCHPAYHTYLVLT